MIAIQEPNKVADLIRSDAPAADARNALGLGSMATRDAEDFELAGAAASITAVQLGVYTISEIDNIISNRQPIDGDLTALAALTGTGFARRTGSDIWTVGTLATGDIPDLSSIYSIVGHTHTLSQITDLDSWAGSESLITLGTVASGTWHGTPIAAAYLGSGTPAAGKYLDGGTGAWTALPAGNPGTVTSVALTVPGVLFSSPVSGSPVTSSGTLALALVTQTANTVLAGPTSGAAATPTMRALVAADVPTLAHSALSGLTAGDDHTQYALLAGRSGGQTLAGDTASAGGLTLNSTAHATKGNISLNGVVTVNGDGQRWTTPVRLAIGSGNSAVGGNYGIMVGHSNTLSTTAQFACIFGTTSTISGTATQSVAVGISNTVSNAVSGATIVGVTNVISGGTNNTIIGNNTTIAAGSGLTAIGSGATFTGTLQYSVAMGVASAVARSGLLNYAAGNFDATLNLQRQSSTSTTRDLFDIKSSWIDSTDATRKAQADDYSYDTAARLTLHRWADGSNGRVALVAPSSAPTDAHLGNGQITPYLNEIGNSLYFRVKYSNGTLKTAGPFTLT